VGVLGAIGSVFLGAMLAFVVENVRERRMLRAWTARYLTAVAGSLDATASAAPLVRSAIQATRRAVAALLAEEEPGWEALQSLPILVAPDLLGSLQGSALTVVDADTVVALGRVETAAGELALRAAACTTCTAGWYCRCTSCGRRAWTRRNAAGWDCSEPSWRTSRLASMASPASSTRRSPGCVTDDETDADWSPTARLRPSGMRLVTNPRT
jgi:hypothetical protein